jgi:signal transduction histidine kinase
MLESMPTKCKLFIQDNGIGFDIESVYSEKLGLKIMRERAESIGADLTVESSPNEGMKVSMLWQPAVVKK